MSSRTLVLDLPTEMASDPTENQTALLAALERTSIAEGWIAYGIGQDNESLAPFDVTSSGVGEQFFANCVVHRHMWPDLMRYDRTPASQRNRFCTPDDLMRRSRWEVHPIIRALYLDAGFSWWHRMVVTEGPFCRGYVSSVWREGSRIESRTSELLQVVAPQVQRYTCAVFQEPGLSDERWLATPEGRLLFASGPLRDTLRAALGACIRVHDQRPDLRLGHMVRGMQLYTTRMQHEGTVAYLVEPAPLRPVRLRAVARLTPTLLRVAERAAEGLSAREIAAERGVSVHTIRTQLKAIYDQLGANNRVELTSLLGP